MLNSIARDARFALRSFRRTPGWTVVALLTLMVGVGATVAVFSVVDGVLLRPLPYPEPGRLVFLHERSADRARMAFGAENFRDVRRVSRTLERVAYFGSGPSTILGAGEPVRVQAAAVSDGFFEVLGVMPRRGRTPRPEEGTAGLPPTAVISHAFWRDHLGGDPDWQQRHLRIGANEARIVGIMPPEFDFPAGVQVWTIAPDDNPSRTAHNWSVIGRLAPGASIAQARAELTAHFSALKAQLGRELSADAIAVLPLREELAGSVRQWLLVLSGAVGLVLLIACVNLASASLARGEARQRELALRTALGAGRGELVRQLLTETVMLAVAGGVLGIGLAWVLVRTAVLVGPGAIPAFADLRLDLRVLAFALGTSIVAGLLIGIAPALGSTRDLRGVIASGSSGAVGIGRRRMRDWLIGAEVAFALALLVGAGLLVRTLRAVLAEDPGFRTEQVLTADLSLPASRYGDAGRFFGDSIAVTGYFDALLPRLRALPGVTSIGLVNQIPLGGGGMGSGFMVDGGTEIVGGADYRIVDAGYFEAMGIPLLRGRGFEAGDRSGAPHVVVITRTMAERFWPGEEAIGHRIRLPGMDDHRHEWLTIVGIVGDVRHRGLDASPSAQMFIHYRQRPERLTSGATIVARSAVAPAMLAGTLRAAIREQDPTVPVELSSMGALLDRSVAPRRFSAFVLTSFALLAVFLAAVGIYGVLAYSVAQRSREIGVRLALGARESRVRGMVVRDALRAVIPGLIVGVVGALGLARGLGALLYGVEPTDPATYLFVGVLLLAVALAASWIPARRATRVSPMLALRND